MAEKLTIQQQTAVSDRGGNLLVSAAAGSGKTKVLVDRLMSYLTDPADPANLDDFVIITYTKAAATELRGKIGAKLTQLLSEDPQNRHLRRQMQRLYLTKISTVHAFCGDILREYAYMLEIPGDFRVADETECAQIQLQVLEKILEEAYEHAHEDPEFCALVDTQGLGRDDRQIPQIILKVYQSAKCHLDPEGWLQWCCDCVDTANVNDAGQTLWGKYLIDGLRSELDLHIDAISRCSELARTADEMEKPAALLEQLVSQLMQLRDAQTWDEILARKEIDYGRLTFSKKITDILLAEQIKAVRGACKEGLEKRLCAFCDPSEVILQDLSESAAATRGLVALAKQFASAYDKRKRALRILDFGDLEHRTLDLLIGKKRTGPTTVAKELGARYREIMVDEYQDSNGVQDAIFGALTYNRNNCFMVGDVKQSIYQFRLADPEIFVEKYNTYAPAGAAQSGEGRKVLLSSNFRSSNGIISAVNDVFKECMSEKVGGLDYGEDEQLREGLPHVDIGEPEVELYGVEVNEDTYAEEAAFVADRVQTLLDGSHMVRQGDTLRPIVADDIVILLRSPGSVGGEFVYALEQRGIRCTTGSSVDLLQTPEISDLRSILQVISNPLQDIPLLAVLSSKVFGFTADNLAAIRGQDRRCSIYDAVCKSQQPKVKAFLQILNQLRADARVYTLTELLHRILTITRIDSIYAAAPNGRNAALNLQTFCQIAADYENGAQRGLNQFLEHLEALDEKGLVLAGQEQEQGAVTIMSIHKSKGLEFPVVFLCGLARRFNQESARGQVLCHKELGLGLSCVDSKNRVRYPTIAKRAISTKIIEESISEELRVLYVAMTRARDRLIMTYAVPNLEKTVLDIGLRMDLSHPLLLTAQVGCPGEWVLQSALRRTEAGAFFEIGVHPQCVQVRDVPWFIRVVQAPQTVDSSVHSDVQRAEVPKELLDRIRDGLAFSYKHKASVSVPSKQTATQLKGRFKDQEAAENTHQIMAHTFRKAEFAPVTSRGALSGNAMHSVMQYIRYENCGDMKGIKAEIERLVQQQFISSDMAALVDPQMIADLFQTDLGKKMRSDIQLLREFKFSILVDAKEYADGVEDDEILLQGVVDCAMIEPDGITVIDYKTDAVTTELLNERVAFYTPQVLTYAKALNRIFKCETKAAYLYFFRLNRFVKVDID